MTLVLIKESPACTEYSLWKGKVDSDWDALGSRFQRAKGKSENISKYWNLSTHSGSEWVESVYFHSYC